MNATLVREVKCDELNIEWTKVSGMTHVEAAKYVLETNGCELELDKKYKVQTRTEGSQVFFDHLVTVTTKVYVLPLRQLKE